MLTNSPRSCPMRGFQPSIHNNLDSAATTSLLGPNSMDIPQAVRSSALYAELQKDPDLLALLQSIRQIVANYAQTSIRTIPAYTDHTVKHMDALCGKLQGRYSRRPRLKV